MISETWVADSHKQVTKQLAEVFEAWSSGLPLLQPPSTWLLLLCDATPRAARDGAEGRSGSVGWPEGRGALPSSVAAG